MSDVVDFVRGRLNSDLLLAMKSRDLITTTALRSLLAALDNASAVPMSSSHVPVFGRLNDVPRKVLAANECAAILNREAASRRAAAEEYERLGRSDEAARLRQELAAIQKYLIAT